MTCPLRRAFFYMVCVLFCIWYSTNMNTNEEILSIMRKQERDRETGKKVAGVLGVIVIAPFVLVALFAIFVIAGV